MSVQAAIERKLGEGLTLAHLEVSNESHNHNVPPGSESHFRLVVVSDDFQGKSEVARHQLVYGLLAEEMRERLHALSLHTYTAADWRSRAGAAPLSPPCYGGEKKGR